MGIVRGFQSSPLYEMLGVQAGFRFTTALTWAVMGLFPGLVFVALGMLLEHQEETRRMVFTIVRPLIR